MNLKNNDFYIAQIEAVVGKLSDSEVFFENKIRRWFSSNFHVPLPETFNLSWAYIIQQYFEDRVEKADYNSIFDLAVENYLPELGEFFEEDNQKFADSLKEEQQKTLESRREKANGGNNTDKSKGKKIPKIKEYNLEFED